ncbi:TolA protein [Minicystis rosea]|nr:TolA protein [Minicystis rosea]
MGHSPLHLTDLDFDAYAPEKATSKAFSRPRLEVKQRALAWARGVVARLAELGISVDVHGSDEHPSLRNKHRVDCQWVFFWRDQAARDELERLLDRGRSIAAVIDDPSPYTRHAFLALRLDATAVEVCFAVHPEAQVDVDNLRARLAEGADALTAELMRGLASLPDEFAVGVAEGDRTAASKATPELMRSMIERAAAGQVPLWIGWSIKRATAVEHSALLDDQLEDAIIALAPIYRLVAWSRENDHIALDRRIQSAEEERAKAHAAAEAETEKWRAEQAEARRRSTEEALARAEEQRRAAPVMARRPTLDSLFGPPPGKPAPAKAHPIPSPRPEAPKPPKPARPAPSEQAAPAPAAAPRPPRVEPVSNGGAPAASTEKVGTLDKGSRVRVCSGPFAEKVGVIGELDGRGGARVLLGLLSTRLELSDLEPVIEGRAERPAIQSSHRKPIAPAPRKAR